MNTLDKISKGFPELKWLLFWDTQLEKETIMSEDFYNSLIPEEKSKFIRITNKKAVL